MNRSSKPGNVPVGLLGGTFDPPHRGHLALARAARKHAGLARVLLVPARVPPHKSRPDLSSPEDRLAMTRRLAAEEPGLEVSAIELDRPGPSYTVDTVRALLETHPDWRLRLILGADMARDFASWREAETLLRLAPPLVADRPGTDLPPDLAAVDLDGLSLAGRRLLQAGRFPFPPHPISSTRIRQAVAAGTPPADLLPPGVLAYIEAKGLYRHG